MIHILVLPDGQWTIPNTVQYPCWVKHLAVGSNVITDKTPEVVTGKIPVTGKTKNTSTRKNTKKVTSTYQDNENQENIPITTKGEPRNVWFAPRPKANPLKSILRSKR
jgi:hypothetical protein